MMQPTTTTTWSLRRSLTLITDNHSTPSVNIFAVVALVWAFCVFWNVVFKQLHIYFHYNLTTKSAGRDRSDADERLFNCKYFTRGFHRFSFDERRIFASFIKFVLIVVYLQTALLKLKNIFKGEKLFYQIILKIIY